MGSFTNWRGISPENSLSRYHDNFFTDSFRRAWDEDLPRHRSQFTPPAVNVRKEEEIFLLEFAAPGYQKSDFDIQIKNRTLTIRAEKKLSEQAGEHGQDGENPSTDSSYTRREFYYHSFSRSFNLPENVVEDKIEASYNNGILTIKIPVESAVQEQQKARKISVAS